jgi:hypothetical protein
VAITPTDHGYWVVTAEGRVLVYGDAGFYGSIDGGVINAPLVGLAPTPTGNGYWLAAADGGIFTFGDATFHGSLGQTHLNAPIVGIAQTPTGNGYWLAAADGGIFTFGDATFHGSGSGLPHAAPAVAIDETSDGGGYVVATGTPESPAPPQLTGVWACIAQHESGGNPRAVNPAGYYGLFQFSLAAWASVGGKGNPIDASPAEQLMRAQMLQARAGWGQWSTARLCGV